MPRSLIIPVLFLAAFAGGGCRENRYKPSFCDQRGCFTCDDATRAHCWPLPHDPCATTADCKLGDTCTNIGCVASCQNDTQCRVGEYCNGNGWCAPVDVNVDPVDPGTNPPPVQRCASDAECSTDKVCNAGVCVAKCTRDSDCGTGAVCQSGKCYVTGAPACGLMTVALCTSDAACGTGRVCSGGNCHMTCKVSNDCPLGQGCAAGVCVDAPPATPQCVWDADCGPATRCINATCHPLCGNDAQCSRGAFCDSGVCRADYRPVR